MKSGRILRRLAWCAPVLIVWLAVGAGAEPDSGRGDRLAAKRAAAEIDKLVERDLREAGLKPNGIASDETFARRSYLTIAGRIPTATELDAFTGAASSEKYYRLADKLLASRGHESAMFNWWADLLRTRSRLPRRISGEPYIHWTKEAIAKNRPYDEMVRELLTAKGPVHERGNGATGYLMRDRNMPEDNMSNTIRLFLGSRVECAQCHNHPFDKWTQKQYFEMVAFTGGIRYAQSPRRDERVKRLSQQAQATWGKNGVRALRRTMEPLFTGIYGSGTGLSKLPKDYQYDDGKPGDWITAHPVFDPAISLNAAPPVAPEPRRNRKNRNKKKQRRNRRAPPPKEIDSRDAFAEWMTSRDNDRFATVIANRMWKQTFGRGLIEPIDDIKDDTTAVAPALMDHLTRLMIELDFDLREFQRVLYYTRLWRREACAPALETGKSEDLRGPLLRRMTAEQAWDSLLTLVADDLDSKLGPTISPRAEQVYKTFESLSKAGDEAVLKQAGKLALRYSDPQKAREMQRQERARQRKAMQAKKREARPLYKELGRARKAGDHARVAEISKQLLEMGLRPPGARGGKAVRDLQRASDLPSPAPDGHLLREMGQSERDLIDGAHTDPTVPQVLALLNAFLEQRLLTNRGAALMQDVARQSGPKAKIRTAFLGVLGRTPTSSEKAMWERDIARHGDAAVQDLVWTLVNTHEFLFVQ